MTFQFRPRLAVAALIALAILFSLGTWQLRRLEWKQGLIAKVERRLVEAPIPLEDALARAKAGEDMEYQPIFLDAAFDHAKEAHVFGVHDGAAGVFVFTPATLEGGAMFFINRGFAPQSLRAASARPEGQVEGVVRIEGLFRLAERRTGVAAAVQPKDQLADNLFFTRDPALIAAARGGVSEPYYVDSIGRESPGPWPKGGLTRVDFSNRHLEYALTWYGLAASLIAVYAAMSLRPRK